MGDLRGLLTNSDIDANDALLAFLQALVDVVLVDHRIDSQGSLARAAVTNDQFALPTPDWHERINHFDAGLHRRAHVLAFDNARRNFLNKHQLGVRVVDDCRAVINWVQQRIRHAPDQLRRTFDRQNPTGRFDLVAGLQMGDLAEGDDVHLLFFQVKDHTGYIARQQNDLAHLGLRQAISDNHTVTHRGD